MFNFKSYLTGKTKIPQLSINWIKLKYKSAPADNPLKGFVPFRGVYSAPHSMEFFYISLRELMDAPAQFKFNEVMDPVLDEIASRGNQAILRIYLDYPEHETGVPQFLLDEGLILNSYDEYGGGYSPDYTDEKLISTLESFISAFGLQYDGDPRIAFITAGLLGFWGEWHTYPHEDWFPGKSIQNRILYSYMNSFKNTRILLRTPSADSPKLSFGYHDDSFCWSTLPTINWHFWSLIQNSDLEYIWKYQPIGGELRPEIQYIIFEDKSMAPEDFDQSVQLTHCSWLLNQAFFENPGFNGKKLKNALKASKSLGYELYINRVKIENDKILISIENNGIAPFYYPWKVEIASIDNEKNIIKKELTENTIQNILPGESKIIKIAIDDFFIKNKSKWAILKVVNPLSTGKGFKFANKEQDLQLKGWITLGEISN